MENNFETGGFSGGASMPDPGSSGEIYPGESLEQAQTGPIGSSMTHLDYLKDGKEGIFRLEEVSSQAQDQMSETKVEKEWDIMKFRGTSHQKLESLAQMSDEEVDEIDQPIESEGNTVQNTNEAEISVQPEEEKLSFEEQVIKLQAETMKLLAESMSSGANKKDLDELLKKLQELMEEAEKDKKGKKATLLTGLFGVIMILIQVGEKGYKMVEDEVKEAQE
jgi:hypothetical protein